MGFKTFIKSFGKSSTPLPYFNILRSNDNQFYWVLYAPNHEVIAVSEMYVSEANALRSIRAVRKYAADAIVN